MRILDKLWKRTINPLRFYPFLFLGFLLFLVEVFLVAEGSSSWYGLKQYIELLFIGVTHSPDGSGTIVAPFPLFTVFVILFVTIAFLVGTDNEEEVA